MAAFRNSIGRWKGSLLTASAAAGALLAGIAPQVAAEGWYGAPPPVDYADKGALRLQLGQTAYPGTTAFPNAIHKPVPPRFVYETAGRPDRTSFTQPYHQSFLLNGKCGGALDATVPQLVTMASGPNPNTLGFGPDSIGVYDGPRGVACYRITAAIGESLRFDLGPGLKSLTAARSFYRLELDIEVKQGAKFELQMLRGGEPYGTPWVLESGSSVLPSASMTPGAKEWACTARSDSGPDAGPLDNCRWVINEVGDGFILKARAGEGSLEAGGDNGSAAYLNNSIVFLTDVEVGSLGCSKPSGATASPYTSTIGDGTSSAQCSVTRVDPALVTGGAYTCSRNVGYLFRTLSGGTPEGCEILKDVGEQQIAAVMDILFPPEPRTEIADTPPTWVMFEGSADRFYPPRCKGTLDLDANDDGLFTDPTIVEVLAPTAAFPPVDFIPGGPVEWACILEDEVDYIEAKSATGGDQQQIRQRILFWGDFTGGRF